MNERHIAPQSPETNVIQFSPRLSHEERTRPYEELGGLRRDPELEESSEVRNRTFFHEDERTEDNAWQVEVNRAYDLGLNGLLQPAHLKDLSEKDLQTLATAVHELRVLVYHRPRNLLVGGNDKHLSFTSYGFTKQTEANAYAQTLFMLGDALDEQPVVEKLIEIHQGHYGRKPVPLSKLSEARKLRGIVIDDNDKVSLIRSEQPARRHLQGIE